MKIDVTRCTGCGTCASTCPQEAITIRNNLATINRDLCIECGRCAVVCPSGAISEEIPAAREPVSRSGGTYAYKSVTSSRPGIFRGRGGRPRYRRGGLLGEAFTRRTTRPTANTPVREDKLVALKHRTEEIKRNVAEMQRRIQALEKK